jgi:general secretion pathway protein D
LRARGWAACALAGALSGAAVLPAQEAQSAVAAAQSSLAESQKSDAPSTKKKVSRHDRRRAAELYLEAGKLFEKEKFAEAQEDYERAAELDPSNGDYPAAGEVAKSHRVAQLVQQAAKDRLMGKEAESLAALRQARDLDPHNALVTEHLYELGKDVAPEEQGIYSEAGRGLGPVPQLEPQDSKQSFHIHADAWQALRKVYSAYGIEVTLDQSVQPRQVRFDIDNANYEQAINALSIVSGTFAVAIDPHRALIASDTTSNRRKFERLQMETLYLPGLTPQELQDVSNLAKTVFDARHLALSQSTNTLTMRAPPDAEEAFNATLRSLLDGRSQVMLDVRLIQLAHTRGRNTGAVLPQQLTAFNVYSEEQSILNANQALVQQIISSGLASPNDPLAILGILIASGQVSGSIFENGIALFGGGLTLSGLSPGPATLNLALNSSDSKELDDIQLRLGDDEDGTIRSGFRYPIETSSFSSLSNSAVNIPGLTLPGTSSSLTSLLSSLGSTVPNIPQVQYQDLGLTLKARPRVMRNGNVALTLDFKLTALAGPQVNGVPVLNNRSYSGVVQVKEGAGVVLVSELSEQESRALSGTPGLSEIPGMNDLTGKQTERDYATLLIVITPHVVRGLQAAGHTPMLRIERDTQ